MVLSNHPMFFMVIRTGFQKCKWDDLKTIAATIAMCITMLDMSKTTRLIGCAAPDPSGAAGCEKALEAFEVQMWCRT